MCNESSVISTYLHFRHSIFCPNPYYVVPPWGELVLQVINADRDYFCQTNKKIDGKEKIVS